MKKYLRFTIYDLRGILVAAMVGIFLTGRADVQTNARPVRTSTPEKKDVLPEAEDRITRRVKELLLESPKAEEPVAKAPTAEEIKAKEKQAKAEEVMAKEAKAKQAKAEANEKEAKEKAAKAEAAKAKAETERQAKAEAKAREAMEKQARLEEAKANEIRAKQAKAEKAKAKPPVSTARPEPVQAASKIDQAKPDVEKVEKPKVEKTVVNKKAVKPVTKPDLTPTGKVAMVNMEGRFVVVSFPGGLIPQPNHHLTVYRDGLKVSELKVTGPSRDNSTVADITVGEVRAGDEVRED